MLETNGIFIAHGLTTNVVFVHKTNNTCAMRS
jgi:hypothetical protein